MRSVELILQDVQIGNEIPESELLYYIHHTAKKEFQSGFQIGATREYSAVWYDYEAERSHVVVIRASNSVVALNSLRDQSSGCHSISAYPVSLPTTLKFKPDSQEGVLTLESLLQAD